MSPEALAVYTEIEAAHEREATAYQMQAAAERLRQMLLEGEVAPVLSRDEIATAADVLHRTAGVEASAGMRHRTIAGQMPGFAEYHRLTEPQAPDFAAFLLSQTVSTVPLREAILGR